MPYFVDQNLEDEDKEQDPSTVQISGASPTTDNEGGMSEGSNQQGNKKDLVTGSGYQNLDKYLSTNDSQKFGQQVVGKVGEDVQKVESNIGEARANTGKIQEQNKTPTMEQVNSSLANPVGANAQEFQGWLNQTYQGPKSVADVGDWNKYQSSANKAETSAKLLGSEPGRFTLLDSYFGRPSYSQGEKSLDNLLVQNAGIGRDTKNLQNQVTSLRADGAKAGNELQNTISGTGALVDKSREATRGAIGIDDYGQVITGDNAGAIGKQWSAVDQAVAQANSQRQAENARLTSALSSGSISDQDKAALGLGSGDRFNLNLSNYFTGGQSLNKNQVMTPEQQANIRALSQLAGVTDTYAANDLSAKSNPYIFDNARFKNDVSAAEASYNNSYKDITQSLGPNGLYENSIGSFNTQRTGDPQQDIANLKAEMVAIEGERNLPDSSKEVYRNEAAKHITELQNLLNTRHKY